MRLSELQTKEIINMTTGKRLGMIIDVIISTDGTIKSLILEEKKIKWETIENYVLNYKKQFEIGSTTKQIEESKEYGKKIIEEFEPLIKKYLLLLKTGQINFFDSDIKIFVSTFIDNPRLHRALKRQKSRAEFKSEIYKKFSFIVETYGQLPEEDIIIDLQMLLLTLAKRYKNVGKNFCAYVHNSYRFEVSRYIKKFIKNPLSTTYKNIEYEKIDNYLPSESLEDSLCNSNNDIPDMDWINGNVDIEAFNVLTPLERKIIVKYYAEKMNDKQISDLLGWHINTVNQKRRKAINKLADALNINKNEIKRSRHSGSK